MLWNLHLDPPAPPAYNMAKDEFCLAQARGTGRPTLRLYGWDRFALSVGRAQKVEREIDLAACAAEGVPIVRRITGGRAVLHGSDLTYAVSAPTSLPGFQGGVLAVYKALSGVFDAFLAGLGAAPQVKSYSGRERAALSSAICFYTPSAFEILVGGKKLVGSAQRLLPDAFLQHGSIPLAPQGSRIARLFHGAAEGLVESRMTDLETLGILPALSEEKLREGLVEAFSAQLGAEFQEMRLDAEGEGEVAALMKGYPPLGREGGAPRERAPFPPPRA